MGRPQTEETKQKIRKALLGRKRPDLSEYYRKNPKKRYSFTREVNIRMNKRRWATISSKSFEESSLPEKRRRIWKEQNEKCNHCGIKEWNGKPLSFHLEHKNGVHSDNRRYNLEIICPNCHTQTATYGNKTRSVDGIGIHAKLKP